MQLDKFFPAWAARRADSRLRAAAAQAALQMLQDTGGASALAEGGGGGGGMDRWLSPFKSPAARDARADQLPRLRTQYGQSRDLVRTNPIAAGAIETNVGRGVGTGLALSATPNAFILGWSAQQVQAWRSVVHAEFSLWADTTMCDWEGELNFYQKQGLTLRSMLESGDCFTLLPDAPRTAHSPYALRLQTVEADRCGNPLGQMDTDVMAGGVRLSSEQGGPEAYHFYRRHPGAAVMGRGNVFAGDWYERLGRSGRRRVLHHYKKLRAGQVRGVPYLAPIIETLQQISNYTKGELMAAVISSYLTIFIETPTGDVNPIFQGSGGSAQPSGGSPSVAPPGADQDDRILELGQGAVVGLMPGEKPHIVNPSRPNPNFEPFILALIKQIGMALGLPYELLLKQFNSSYSASKAALLDAAVYFKNLRYWLSLSFCQPVYETWLAEAVAIGRVHAPGFFSDPLVRWAYTRASWHGDSMGSINPKDEVAAYREAIDARLMTHERAEWELFGSDWHDTYSQKLAEKTRMDADGLTPAPRSGAAAAPTPAPETSNANETEGAA